MTAGRFRVLFPAGVLALLISESALLYGAYVAAVFWFGDLDGEAFLFYERGFTRIGVAVGLLLIGFFFRDLYSDLRLRSRTQLLQQLSLILGVAFIVQAVIGYLNLDLGVPPRILIPGSALALIAILLWRMLFRVAMQNAVGARRVLFLGTSSAVFEIAGYMDQHPELGFSPIGYLESADDPPSAAGVPRLGPVDELPALVDEHRPDWLVVSRRTAIRPNWVEEFLELRFGGVDAAEAAAVYEATLGRVCLAELRPTDLFLSGGLQPLRISLNLQTLLSNLIAAIALVVASPFLLLLMLAVRISTGGPVFLRETCVGLGGASFLRYRLRTTRPGEFQKTAIGHWIRRFGLDALPQLWNVLRGDMSLVGPEPDRPEFFEQLGRLLPPSRYRTAVKPGITGWAQINAFRDSLPRDAARRAEYDLYYIKNLSVALDFFVLSRAIRDALVDDPS